MFWRSVGFTLLLSAFCSFGSAQESLFQLRSLSGVENLSDNAGIAVADYNRDGHLDFYIVATADYDSTQLSTWGGLFENNNDATFTDVSIASGLHGNFDYDLVLPDFQFFEKELRYGASWGDYDNDGYPDLFLTNYQHHQLFHNRGDGTFEEATEASGLSYLVDGFSANGTWVDYNNDGYLDLLIPSWFEQENNRLFTNNTDGTFSDDSDKIAFDANTNTWMILPTDVNEDGWIDLLFVNDFVSNRLLINNAGTFEDATRDYNLFIEEVRNHMGATYGDIDNDGDFDIYVSDINKNELWIYEDGSFVNSASELAVERTNWSWKTRFSDLDLDGDLDLTVINGYQSSFENTYFHNDLIESGNLALTNMSASNGFGEVSNSMSFEEVDFDHDGDQDFLITQLDGELIFLENLATSASGNSWVKVELEGTLSNRDGIGSVIEITDENGRTQRHFYTGVGFMGQSLQPITFGLGVASSVSELKIKWPSGQEDTYMQLPSKKTIKATEAVGFEILERSSNRIAGCTDSFSCNYDPNATIDNGSCEYLQSGSLTGPATTGIFQIETYHYQAEEGAEIVWKVDGGEIISGEGTSEIQVQWGITDSGSITVYEVLACRSEPVSMEVFLTSANRNSDYSVPRYWNEALLEAIRNDYARPTVHARNLFHSSAMMHDLFALYTNKGSTYLPLEKLQELRASVIEIESNELDQALEEAISAAMYAFIQSRFKDSPDFSETYVLIDHLYQQLGVSQASNSIEIGRTVAQQYLDYGLTDGAREAQGYDNVHYQPVNTPLAPDFPGNPICENPNRWQPLELIEFIDQSGNPIGASVPDFLSPEWGNVTPFALTSTDMIVYNRDEHGYTVYYDPGAPPYIANESASSTDEYYKWGFSLVSIWASHLDPYDGVEWDISPASIGNIDFELFPSSWEDYGLFYDESEGGDIGNGRMLNPITNQPYAPQLVPRGDYARVLAEFWADGPDSETPPGHWYTILNYVNDHPDFERKFEGEGEELSELEWDIKAYFTMGGAMHDAAISAWSVKGWYDYIRPISAIRYMAEKGQSTSSDDMNYHEQGIPLKDGFIEVVREGDRLEGHNKEHIGKIKLWTWKGHDFIDDPISDEAGVGWVLAENWWPYQRPSFVTPPFAGYVSGHSTYSRAAAEVMTLLTGSEFFPGGMGEFIARKNEFLVFEEGPSVDVVLQWATYRDASDQCSLSRIWGGIHPPADDIPGRKIGREVGIKAFEKARTYFEGSLTLSDETDDMAIRAYPNPVSKGSGLLVDNLALSDLKVYDQLGKKVPCTIESINGKMCITFPKSVKAGLYILKSHEKSLKIFIVD